MELSGSAKSSFEVIDYTPATASYTVGAACVMGITERGTINKPVLVKSWAEYQRYFGGLLAFSVSRFPYLCYRALKRKTPLYISPVGHYATISDNTSGTGVKATGTSGSVVAETRATGGVTITAAGVSPNSVIARVAGVAIGSFAQSGSLTPTQIATGLAANITSLASTNGGYTATSSGAVVTILSPVGSGAYENGKAVTVVVTGSLTATVANLSGGVTATAVTTWQADNEGDWANGNLSVVITNASSGTPKKVDISVKLKGYPALDQVMKDVTRTPNASDVLVINAFFELVNIQTAGTLDAATVAFTLGDRDNDLVVTTDYVGDATAGTGINSFDEVKDAVRIAVLDVSDPVLDAALVTYVDTRKDMMAVLKAPLNSTGSGAKDYRNGTGIYSHSPVNSWRAIMTFGGLKTNHPTDFSIQDHPEAADVLANWSTAEQKGYPWSAFAGLENGVIPDALNVLYDLQRPSRQSEFDQLDAAGLTAVIKHPSGNCAWWGSNTMYKGDATSPLNEATVAAGLIWLFRNISVNLDLKLFQPNNPKMWSQLYLLNKKILDYYKEKGGCYDYIYQGDQDAEKIEDATLNTLSNIDTGKYIIRVFVKPTRLAKYIGFQLGVTSTSVNFEEILELTQ